MEVSQQPTMVYNYTKPRAPIAAMYRSPGPCYALPSLVGAVSHDPRSSHERGRTWHFGTKHTHRMSADSSPGPVYYPDMRITRCGVNGAPHFSLYGRQKDITVFQAPPPGTYSPEKAGPSSCPKPPSFSFGSRTRHRTKDNVPAANTYSLPPMLGKTVESNKRAAPAFSQTTRSKTGGFDEDLQKTPGPGTYSVTDPNVYNDKKPSFSMTSRNMMPGDSTQKPGPGAHSPEKVRVHKPEAPHTSFGIRHSDYTTPLIVDVQD